MNLHRIVAAGTVIFIVGVTIASGPIVGLSLLTEAEEFEPGHGTLNATVVSTPENATLEAAEYSVEGYHLRAAPIEMRIHDVAGQPTVAYDIVIHKLNHTRSSVTFLDSSFIGDYELKFSPTTLNSDRIHQDEYTGTLRVVILNEEDIQTLIVTDIRIKVDE